MRELSERAESYLATHATLFLRFTRSDVVILQPFRSAALWNNPAATAGSHEQDLPFAVLLAAHG